MDHHGVYKKQAIPPAIFKMADTAPLQKRFASLSEDEIASILNEKDSINTKRVTKHAVTVFETYLKEKNYLVEGTDQPIDWVNLPDPQLAGILKTFYAQARTAKGELYHKNSMASIRSGLTRHLNSKRRELDTEAKAVDLTKDAVFTHANDMYKSMKRKMKESNKAAVTHHDSITTADLQKLHAYFNDADKSPKVLQHQVFVNLMMFFGRRGREGLRWLKTADFAVTTDENQDLYLYKSTDERTKNHQEDGDKKQARMYQNKGS